MSRPSNQPQGRPSALLHVLARSVPPWGVTASEGQALVSIVVGWGIPKRLGLCHGKSMDDGGGDSPISGNLHVMNKGVFNHLKVRFSAFP